MEVTGKLQSVGETVKISDKFQKREFVVLIDHNSQYAQPIVFELQQDKCDIIDAYQLEQEIIVAFNLRGRQWNGPEGIKTFNTLAAWKIQPVKNQ